MSSSQSHVISAPQREKRLRFYCLFVSQANCKPQRRRLLLLSPRTVNHYDHAPQQGAVRLA
jgi:hypothetical protein